MAIDVAVLRSGDPVSRAQGDQAPMVVRFSSLNSWYRIDSWWEGSFLERIAPGAFADTMRERGPSGDGSVRTMFNHGRDPSIGGKSLGVPSRLAEEDGYAVAEVPLLDTSYVRDLIPGIEARAYGASFMFDVIEHSVNEEPSKSEHNPDGVPERTITAVRLYEQGPVTWPANPSAYASIGRSSSSYTDMYYDELIGRDSAHAEELAARCRSMRFGRKLDTDEVQHRLSRGRRLAALRAIQLEGAHS